MVMRIRRDDESDEKMDGIWNDDVEMMMMMMTWIHFVCMLCVVILSFFLKGREGGYLSKRWTVCFFPLFFPFFCGPIPPFSNLPVWHRSRTNFGSGTFVFFFLIPPRLLGRQLCLLTNVPFGA